MSENKQQSQKIPETTSVDWAEKLKASMDRDFSEPSMPETHKNHADDRSDDLSDDLNALLRAQLGKRTEDITPIEDLDTSEFEDLDLIDDEFDDETDDAESDDELAEDFEGEYDEEDFDEEFEESDSDEEDYEEEPEDDADEFTDNDEMSEDFEEEFEDYESDADPEDEEYPEDEFDESDDESDAFESYDYINADSELESFKEEPDTKFDYSDSDDSLHEEEFDDDLNELTEEDEWTEDLVEDSEEDQEEFFDDDEMFDDEKYQNHESESDDSDYKNNFEDKSKDLPEWETQDETTYDELEDEAYNELDYIDAPTIYPASVLSVSPTAAEPTVKPEFRKPASDAWTDNRLNSPITGEENSVENRVGGNLLHELALENQRLVAETQALPMTDSPADFPAENPENPDVSHFEPKDEPKNSDTAGISAQIYDPMQLGLDDISPTFKAAKKAIPEPPEISSETADKQTNYTDHMEDKHGEESALGDTDLYIRLGYEDSLRRADDQLRVEKLRTETSEKRYPRSSGEQPAVRVDREYRGREDTDRVEEAYNQARHKNIARLLIAVMGALIGLAYDFLPVLWQESDPLDPTYARLYAPMGLVWTILICLPFISRLGRGLKSILDFEPTRYAVSGVALAVSFLHGIIVAILGFTGSPFSLPLFGGAALFMLAIAALAELLVTEGEYRAFTVVSSGKPTHILTDESTPASAAASTLPVRNDGAKQGGRKKRVLTVVRAGRVADYFARTQRYNPYMGRLNYFLPVALLAAIICSGLEVAMGGDLLTDGLRVFTATYLTCLPSAYVIAMTLPLCTANGYLSKKGTAVIGTAAPVDYAGKGPAQLIFSDGDALKALYRKDITLRGDPHSDEYRRMAEVVFRLLNTPLAVEPALREGRIDNYRIEVAEIDEQYVRLYLVDTEKNHTTEVMMGSHSALTRRGVRLPKLNMEQRYKKSAGSHVLYLAFNRNFHLAFAVEYRVGRTFAHTVATLNDMGCEVILSTFDPLTDPNMEGLTRLRKRGPLDILRPTNFESVRKSRSSGLIATGRSLDLLHPINACRAMLRAYRREHLFSWLAMPVSIALPVLAVCLDGEAWLMSSAIALWHLVSLGLTLWISLAAAGSKALSREPQKETKNSDSKPEKEEKPSEKASS